MENSNDTSYISPFFLYTPNNVSYTINDSLPFLYIQLSDATESIIKEKYYTLHIFNIFQNGVGSNLC